jgi:hypothetical protein
LVACNPTHTTNSLGTVGLENVKETSFGIVKSLTPTFTSVLTPTATPTLYLTKTRTTPIPIEWTTGWLRGDPCYAPCWEGILPGRDTPEEAVAKLKKNPKMQSIKNEENYYNHDRGDISWLWANGQEGGEISYLRSGKNQKIRNIFPLFYVSQVHFVDVIKVYGYPSHIAAYMARALEGPAIFYSFDLVYINYGFDLGSKSGPSETIDENVILSGASFFYPTIEGFDATDFREQPSKWLIPWKGFKDFMFYCQEEPGVPCDPEKFGK